MTPKQQLNGEKWDGELILLPGQMHPVFTCMLWCCMLLLQSQLVLIVSQILWMAVRHWEYETWEILLKELTFTGLAILFFIFIFNYIFSWIFILVMICLLHFCCCCESAGWFYQRIINHYAVKIGWDKTQRQHLSLQTYIFSRTLQYIMKSSLHRDESHP